MKEDTDSASVEVAGSLVLWEPTQGRRRVGGQHYTYVNQFMRDTGLKDVTVREIRSLMLGEVRKVYGSDFGVLSECEHFVVME